MANIFPLEQDIIKGAIKEILKNADLNSLSSKKVRKMLEEKFKTDLTLQKQQIDDLLMELINADEETCHSNHSAQNKPEQQQKPNGTSNNDDEDDDGASILKKGTITTASSVDNDGDGKSTTSSEDDDDEGDNEDQEDYGDQLLSTKPSVSQRGATMTKKKRQRDADDDDHVENGEPKTKKKVSIVTSKKSKSQATANDLSDSEVDDEALARKLQQEELGVRPRNSRQSEKKSRKTTAGDKEPSKKRKSIYAQECVLSEELASVMGVNKMARKDVVSRMWQIFKERNLLDPQRKQYVICDEQLERVFKVKKFRAFGMMRILKHHIKDARLVS